MIDRIVIDNFKSIKHADVKLQKVNLLIGPNNSGKSNFLKSVVAVKNSIHPQMSWNIKDNNLDKAKTDIEIFFNGEEIVGSKKEVVIIDKNWVFDESEYENEKRALYNLAELTNNILIYKPDLSKLHKPYPIFQNDEFVTDNASNISAFLQTCLNKHRKVFNRITSELKNVLPLFDEILIDNIIDKTEDMGKIELRGKNKEIKQPLIKLGIKDTADRTIWAEDLSEGILYFIALLCIIHQPNPPKVLLLEEPERSMHPRRVKEVVDLIRKLSDEKDIQVIMTTHSSLVVDLFEDEPECIQVFEMKDGFTEIKNLKEDIIEPTNKELKDKGIDADNDYGISLGDQWVYGYLGGVPA